MPLVARSRDWIPVQIGYRNLFGDWIAQIDYPDLLESAANFGDGFFSAGGVIGGLGVFVDAKADGTDWTPGPSLGLPGEELDFRSRGHDVAGEGIGQPVFAFPIEITSLDFHHHVADLGFGALGALKWYIDLDPAPAKWTAESPPGSRGEVLVQEHAPYDSVPGGPTDYWEEFAFDGAAVATINALIAQPDWDGLLALYGTTEGSMIKGFRTWGKYAPFFRVGYLEDVPEGLPGEEGGALPWEAGGGPVAFTQAHLDAVEAAIASGSLTVRYADKMRTYRSLDELLRIRSIIRSALGLNPVGPTRQIRPVTRTGW